MKIAFLKTTYFLRKNKPRFLKHIPRLEKPWDMFSKKALAYSAD